MNKRADNPVMENIVRVIIVILFILGAYFYIGWRSSDASIAEEIHAKQIALMIDKAKPGTEISLDILELYEIARKNKAVEKIIVIDNDSNRVSVNLAPGGGHDSYYFSDSDIVWEIKKDEDKGEINLIIEVVASF